MKKLLKIFSLSQLVFGCLSFAQEAIPVNKLKLDPNHYKLSASGSEGTGTRGGGYVDSQTKRLLDHIDPNSCIWVSGKKMISAHPSYSELLYKISLQHPYYALMLKQETEALNFCMMGELKLEMIKNRAHRANAIIDTEKQMGYRENRTVYVNSTLFAALSAETQSKDQADFIYHETLHGFIPMEIQDRDVKLWSLVKTTRTFADGLAPIEAVIAGMNQAQMSIPYISPSNWSSLKTCLLRNRSTQDQSACNRGLDRVFKFQLQALPASQCRLVETKFKSGQAEDELLQWPQELKFELEGKYYQSLKNCKNRLNADQRDFELRKFRHLLGVGSYLNPRKTKNLILPPSVILKRNPLQLPNH